MLRLTLAQMRRSVGRLAAAGIAIAIGTAFVAATLVSARVMERTSLDAVTAGYAQADLVVQRVDDVQTVVDEVAALPGVAAADPVLSSGMSVGRGTGETWVPVRNAVSDTRLDPLTVASGAMPADDGQIALTTDLAERLGVGVGDTLRTQVVEPREPTEDEAAEGLEEVWEPVDLPLRVSGLLDDPSRAYGASGGTGVVTLTTALRVMGIGAESQPTAPVVIALDDGADVEAARTAVADVTGTEVLTRDEAAAQTIEQMAGQTMVLTMVVLGFAAIALLVAGLVITNTFQVLVAQRTRTLALLRCVGITRAQLRRSVLLEGGILGAVASLVGVLGGLALAQVALLVLRSQDLPVPLPARLPVTVAAVAVPVLVGIAVTIASVLVPARAATRVAPVAALRPADPPVITVRGSRGRLVLAVALVVLGVLAMLPSILLSALPEDPSGGLGMLTFLAAVLGGATSFVGVLVGTVFWVPRVVSWSGRLLGRSGLPARLAAANTGRNPRRTTATATALLIGVTLVALMSTGAASARATMQTLLDQHYPVDLALTVPADEGGGEENGPLPAGLAGTVAAVDGVETVVTVGRIPIEGPGSGLDAVTVVSAEDAESVVRAEGVAELLTLDTLVVSDWVAGSLGLTDGGSVEVLTGDEAGSSTMLTVRVAGTSSWLAMVTPETAAALGGDVEPAGLWVRLTDVSDAGTVVPRILDELPDVPLSVEGGGVESATFLQVIDTLLAIVIGLLAVAVVIALIGVANTLSLSVIERRRESATLRAIGLTRRQLRTTLAVEGMLIAGVGALLGVLLGVFYGWAGAASILGMAGDVRLAVPWRDLALVLGIALAAGLLASVLPARSAVRTSPVAALGVE